MPFAVKHHQITYIEFSTLDIARTKDFYGKVFGWEFNDWGPDYLEIKNAGVDGGFRKVDDHAAPTGSAPLVVLYSANLKASEAAVLAAGGAIVTPTFEFPGGRRFHFSDGLGNVLGVWSE